MKPHLTAVVMLLVVFGRYAIAPASESEQPPSPAETIPFSQMKQWLHFTRADLDEVSAESGQLDFSTRFAYEGDYALRWKHQAGDAWVWKCNLKNLGPSPTFYLAALEPQIKGNPPSTFHLQFLDAKNKVACECDMLLARRYWNRCIIRLSSNNGMQVGIKNLTGAIPTTVSAIRLISTGKQAGELFVGSWLLTEQWMVRRDSVAEVDGFPEPSIPDASKLPEPSTAEVSAAKVMTEHFEKGFMADWFNVIGKPYETIATEALSHYKELNLRRTPEGMTGRNLFMEQEIHRGHWCSCLAPKKYQVAAYETLVIPKNTLHAYADFGNGTHAYCALMLDLANCYRRETDAKRKAELLDAYEMMFDYSQYVSGFPSVWFNGEGYVESVFLMRQELAAASRLGAKLLDLLRKQIRFERIFSDRSVYSTAHPGDLGEDCDYTRITSERMIFLSLFESDPRVKVYFLHAFQRWFSRIVLAYAPGVNDTFKPDGSINHHSGLQFGYGNGAIITCARVIHTLAKTPFAIEQAGHALFKNTLMLRRNFSRNGYDPITLSGKDGLQWSNQLLNSPYLLMALAGTPDRGQPIDRDMAAVYLRVINEKRETPHPLHESAMKQFADAKLMPEENPQGHWTLGWSSAAFHRHADWLLAVRGYSRHAYGREADFPIYPHLAFGTMELMGPQNDMMRHAASHESDIAQPGFDWTRFPGTTDVFQPMDKDISNGWGRGARSDQPFVGGVDAPNGDGVFVLSLHGPKPIGLDSFHAHKSWFFFGDTTVCLGTGIHDTVANYETGTTLFQDQWTGADAKGKTHTPLFFNAAESLNTFPLEKQESLASAKWLINRQGVGFYLYSGQQLSLRRAEQQFPDSLGKKETKGNFTTAWLSHGRAPKDASYRYLMRVGVTPESMAALAQSMDQNSPYEILQQNEAAHIVASKAEQTTGYVIFKANSALNDNTITSASQPCVVTTHRADADMVLSVADPDLNFIDNDKAANQWGYSQSSSITITLHGRWKTATDSTVTVTYPKPGKTAIAIGCQNGLTSSIKLIPAPESKFQLKAE